MKLAQMSLAMQMLSSEHIGYDTLRNGVLTQQQRQPDTPEGRHIRAKIQVILPLFGSLQHAIWELEQMVFTHSTPFEEIERHYRVIREIGRSLWDQFKAATRVEPRKQK